MKSKFHWKSVLIFQRKLTENNGNVWEGFNQLILHFIGNLWNFGVLFLVNQPSQKLFFLHQVAFVDVWDASFKQDHCRKVFDTPLVSFIVVINFHKSDVVLIAFVVNVFEFGENLLGFLRVFVVCGNEKFIVKMFSRENLKATHRRAQQHDAS
jgi:hypothetical protein